MDCEGDWTAYFLDKGFLTNNAYIENIYMWLYFLLCIFMPTVALTFCNLNLIRALRKSAKMRQKYTTQSTISRNSRHSSQHGGESHRHITLLLVVIVVMHLMLVVPSEVISFLKYMVLQDPSITSHFDLACVFLNTLQSLNFACNFILYCVLNAHFRRDVRELFCPCKRRVKQQYSVITTPTSTTAAQRLPTNKYAATNC